MAVDKEKARKSGLKRQRAKRARDEEKNESLGIREVRFFASTREIEMLVELRAFRGGSSPYDLSEYVSAFIRQDYMRMEEEKKHLGSCAFCGEPLPLGCKNTRGVPKFKGLGECFYTFEEKKLRL